MSTKLNTKHDTKATMRVVAAAARKRILFHAHEVSSLIGLDPEFHPRDEAIAKVLQRLVGEETVEREWIRTCLLPRPREAEARTVLALDRATIHDEVVKAVGGEKRAESGLVFRRPPSKPPSSSLVPPPVPETAREELDEKSIAKRIIEEHVDSERAAELTPTKRRRMERLIESTVAAEKGRLAETASLEAANIPNVRKSPCGFMISRQENPDPPHQKFMIGGYVDAIDGDTCPVEVKTRMRKLPFKVLQKDIVQLHCYMSVFQCRKSTLVERVRDTDEVRVTSVDFDDCLWFRICRGLGNAVADIESFLDGMK